MKKILVCVLALVCACACLFATACKIEKVYYFESMRVEQDGEKTDVKRNDTFGDIKYDSNSIVLDVKENKTFTFSANGLLEQALSGSWETIDNNGVQETVLNFSTVGLEIIVGSIVNGTATILLYVNGVDYAIILK